MKNKNLIYFFVFMIIALLIFGSFMINKINEKKQKIESLATTVVKRGDFVINLNAVGIVKSENSIAISNRVEGKVIYCINEGSSVKKDDILLKMDDSNLQNDLKQRILDYQQILSNLDNDKNQSIISNIQKQLEIDKLKATVDFQLSKVKEKQLNFEKNKRLLAENLVTQTELDSSRDQLETQKLELLKSQKDLEAQVKQAEIIKRQNQTKIKNTEIQLDIRKTQVDKIKLELENTIIRSTSNGIVVFEPFWGPSGQTKIKEGTELRRLVNIMSIPDLTKMQISIKLAETDIPLIKTGLPVIFSLEAYPDIKFKGKIKEIGKTPQTEDANWRTEIPKRYFDVTIDITEKDLKKIKPGMTANVEIIIQKISDAVYVPISSVFNEKGEKYIYLVTKNNYKKESVETGRKNENYIMITKGLKGGEEIFLSDPEKKNEKESSPKR